MIQAIFNIIVLILGILIWACANPILNKIATTSKHNSNFLIISITYEHNKKNIKVIVMCSLLGFHNHNLESPVLVSLATMLISPLFSPLMSFSFCISSWEGNTGGGGGGGHLGSHTHSLLPPFCMGGSEKFSMLAQRGDLHFFEFLGEK